MSIGSGAYGSSGVQSPGTTPTGYCTAQDIYYRISQAKLAELTNDVSGASEPNTATINDLIRTAYDYTNARLSEAYPDDLPFATTPALIKRINVVLVIYYAMQRRFSVMEIPAAWQKEYDQAMEWLQEIADEQLPLGPDSSVSVSSPEATITAPDASIDFTDSSNPLCDF